MIPKTLADLRCLPIGTKLTLTHCLLGPVPSDRGARTVKRHQSNAIIFTKEGGIESYLWYPKAKYFHPLPDGFEILEEDGEVGARYRMEEGDVSGPIKD